MLCSAWEMVFTSETVLKKGKKHDFNLTIDFEAKRFISLE